jgi:hypothetical protein
MLLDLPPSRAEFREYRAAEIAQAGRPCVDTLGCATVETTNDHASEIRINYSLGALALTGFYLWAVTGWTPGRPGRRRRAIA